MDEPTRLSLARFASDHNYVDLSVGLFDKQLEVFRSEALNKVAVCGRRAGKTTLDARLLLDAAIQHPQRGDDESITAFVGPTKNQAKRLVWGRIQTVAQKFSIPLTLNATDLIIRLDNDAQIWIMGADDNRDVDRLRGFAFRRVIIDEAQAVGADFDDLVEDVLDPALAEFEGDLILTGTPNAACVGYFHDASTGCLLDASGQEQWQSFAWTVLDNPAFPLWAREQDWRSRAAAWLEEKCRTKNWDKTHVTYLREWLGQWIRDEGALVYRYDPARNHSPMGELPAGHDWQTVLGIDLGTRDAFAQVVWAWCDDLPDLYLVAAQKWVGLGVNEWAMKIKLWQERHDPVSTVADRGGLGGAIIDDINKRYGLSIKGAEKKEKLAAIEQMNSDWRASRIWADRGSPYTLEMCRVQWDENRKKEDPRFPNDLSDAGLYGYREALHWAWQPVEHLPDDAEGRGRWEAEKMREARRLAMSKGRGKSYARRRQRT